MNKDKPRVPSSQEAWRLWKPEELTPESQVLREENVLVSPQDEAKASHSGVAHEAWQQGFDQGYKEGSAHVRMETMRLHDVLQGLAGATLHWDQALGEMLVDLTLHLARQVVRHDLRAPVSALRASIQEGLTLIGKQQILIHLHPDDIAIVREQLRDLLSTWPHRLEADATLERGGCRLESSDTMLDASIKGRWERLLNSLGRKSSANRAAPQEELRGT